MDIKKCKLNFRYNLFEKNIVYAFTIFDNILQILHKSYFVRTLQDYYNISTILVIRFEIFWEFYNISKEYFYNIFYIFPCCVCILHKRHWKVFIS